MPRDHRSHTQLTTLMRCERKFAYAYMQGLKPLIPARPLNMGSWYHTCMEASALRRGLEHGSLVEVPYAMKTDAPGVEVRVVTKTTSGDPMLVLFATHDDEGAPLSKPAKAASYPLHWEGAHEMQLDILERMWPAEAIQAWRHKDRWIPEVLSDMLRGYHHHHRVQLLRERPLMVEQEGSIVIDGVRFLFRVDEILLDGSTVVLRDWKTAGQRPPSSTRMTQAQRMLFGLVVNNTPKIQAKLKRKVAALELDYAKSAPPPIPQRNKDGSLSKRQITTTAVVYTRALMEYGMDPTKPPHAAAIAAMDAEDSYFWRDRVPLHPPATREVIKDYLRADVQARLLESGGREPMRDMQLSCGWGCDFEELCIAEMYGQDTTHLRRSKYLERSPDDPDASIDLEDLVELEEYRR